MLLLYVFYIVLMFFNAKVGGYVVRRVDALNLVCCRSPRPETTTARDVAYSEKAPLLDSSSKTSVARSESQAYSNSLQTSNTGNDEKKPSDLTTSGVFQISHKSGASGKTLCGVMFMYS